MEKMNNIEKKKQIENSILDTLLDALIFAIILILASIVVGNVNIYTQRFLLECMIYTLPMFVVSSLLMKIGIIYIKK